MTPLTQNSWLTDRYGVTTAPGWYGRWERRKGPQKSTRKTWGDGQFTVQPHAGLAVAKPCESYQTLQPKL